MAERTILSTTVMALVALVGMVAVTAILLHNMHRADASDVSTAGMARGTVIGDLNRVECDLCRVCKNNPGPEGCSKVCGTEGECDPKPW